MGESACLLHSFSYASGISNEAKEGNPIYALGESISFGRFTSESLSWEKWSTFSHKRYVEEAERYAQPGSVAQKKAFFEAHYKKMAAKKAAALLEQANATTNHPQPEACDSQSSTITYSQEPVDEQEQLEVKAEGTEVDSLVSGTQRNSNAKIGKVKVADLLTGQEVPMENPVKDKSLNKPENVVNHIMVSEKEPGESPLMGKPLLERFNSCQEGPSQKKLEIPSSKLGVHHKAPRIPAPPSKPKPPIHPRRENNATPITGKSTIDSINTKRSTPKSLRELIYSAPTKEPDKAATPAASRIESSRIAPTPYKEPKDCKTPRRTPIMDPGNGGLKHPSVTLPSENRRSENRRSKTPRDPPASGSKTTGPKWHLLSAVCSKSLSACKNKLQSPTLSIPFSLRTEERAARRKQKLEEKFNAVEPQKVQKQTRLKEKAEIELRKFRQSLCFRARPLPDLYKERETPKDQIKNSKTPLTQPESPKIRRKPSSSTFHGMNSEPPETASGENSCPKNVLKKRSQISKHLQSPPDLVTCENTSPNVQH